MVRLLMLLLGVDYLRSRLKTLAWAGTISLVVGVALFVDALDGRLDFPIEPFAWLLLLEGLATLTVASTGMGGQRTLRYVKGLAFTVSASLVLAGHHHGHMILSLIFGVLFLADGLLQVASARVVRYRTWQLAMAGGLVEILLAIFFIQPYPTHYVGTVPYCVGLGLIFGGWNMLLLASRVRRLARNPDDAMRGATHEGVPAAQASAANGAMAPTSRSGARRGPITWDGPATADERALTVHVWTPVGSAKSEARRQPIIDRYIAAVDRDGVISTGHAALESPEGIYISLYPAVEIDRSPDDFTRLLRATQENDVPGVFQPDYPAESKAWCPSTVRVRIRNYDPGRLQAFWERYRQDTTYNLTHRNCSSTVARALDAALEGAASRVWARLDGWWPLCRLLLTPELWVASHLRKRATTMAWTPGLTLDYARAMSMLADPRPFAWATVMQRVFGRRAASTGSTHGVTQSAARPTSSEAQQDPPR